MYGLYSYDFAPMCVAFVVMAYISMAYTVMAFIVIACIVMAYMVMVDAVIICISSGHTSAIFIYSWLI